MRMFTNSADWTGASPTRDDQAPVVDALLGHRRVVAAHEGRRVRRRALKGAQAKQIQRELVDRRSRAAP
jgi:hypothetical protein